ncbi:hypothetical protein HD598_000588 [Neomicrococcus aestuarii]|uniref:N-acetyltransferase domain-containing protein n=1 Tax=Neomicrococcus aestuarii TaxID=556325 RepID=A0A7W8TS40_9MICC|nr:GNAT family N-acetyltransferase [Neomicrococcus aestuarii]MBB5511901.1 hypothetical protein [Neomicrococcus aestuarii]
MNQIIVPRSHRLQYARMQESDLSEMAQLLGDPETMTYYPRPKTREEALAWIGVWGRIARKFTLRSQRPVEWVTWRSIF